MITVKQAADKLKVSARTVLRWIGSGKLEAIKNGVRWQVNESAIEALITEQSQAYTQDKGTDAQSVPTSSRSALLPGEADFISWITEEKIRKDASTT